MPSPLIDGWLSSLEFRGIDLFTLSRPERLAQVQEFANGVLTRIGTIVPVTPVPLACAALKSFEGDFVRRDQLLERMAAMRDVLQELNGRVVRADRDIAETFDRAYRMLRLRRVIARAGDGYLILPRGRPLITYYSNSIVHLLGPFADGVRTRDAMRDAATTGRQPQAKAFFSNSYTFPGLALPPDAFITCPTRNPSTCCLPSLNCPTWAGFFFKTSSIIVAKAPSSETCVSPFS